MDIAFMMYLFYEHVTNMEIAITIQKCKVSFLFTSFAEKNTLWNIVLVFMFAPFPEHL